MALPIDIKDVMSFAGDIDEARQMPVHACVLVDPSAPQDCTQAVVSAMTTDAPNATVDFGVYENDRVSLPPSCDFAVMVAGFSEYTGPVAARIRRSGCPVAVVTTMPEIVSELAKVSGSALLDADVVTPEIDLVPDALAADNDFYKEPYPLSEERQAALLGRLGSWVVDTFKDKRLALALCFPFVRRPLSLEFVNTTAVQNAGVGAIVIIPGADMPVMTANQVKMLLQIAAAYGQSMTTERIKELAGVVGGAFALRAVARQLVGAVPGAGWAIKGGIGYAGTQAMGRAAIAYFEQLVGQGKPVQEAMDAARAEAARAADVYKTGGGACGGAAAVARDYAGRAANSVQNAWDNVAPAVKNAVPAAKDAIQALVKVAEDAGIDPADMAKQAVRSVVDNRKGSSK